MKYNRSLTVVIQKHVAWVTLLVKSFHFHSSLKFINHQTFFMLSITTAAILNYQNALLQEVQTQLRSEN